MAKLSMVNRDIKRVKIAKKYAAKRSELKKIIQSPSTSYEDREESFLKLQKLPRDSSPCRQQRRCIITGRPHGVYQKFGLGRSKIRELVMQGDVPGVRKAGW